MDLQNVALLALFELLYPPQPRRRRLARPRRVWTLTYRGVQRRAGHHEVLLPAGQD